MTTLDQLKQGAKDAIVLVARATPLDAIDKEVVKEMIFSYIDHAYQVGQLDAARSIAEAATAAGIIVREMSSSEDWKRAVKEIKSYE